MVLKILQKIQIELPSINSKIIFRHPSLPIFTPLGVKTFISRALPEYCTSNLLFTPDDVKVLRYDEFISFIQNIITDPSLLKSVNYFSTVLYPVFSETSEFEREGFLRNPHMTAAYIEFNNSENVDIYVFDSKGKNGAKGLIKYLQKNLESYNIRLFVYKNLRQRDDFSCPVFSFLDLKNILLLKKQGYNIYEQILGQIASGAEGSRFTRFDFENLPEYMMKVTQSIRQLDLYIQKYEERSDCYSPIFIDSNGDGKEKLRFSSPKSLQEDVFPYIYLNNDSYKLNKYIEIKYFYFLLKVLESEL